VEIKEGNI